jgi:hypothetical protein
MQVSVLREGNVLRGNHAYRLGSNRAPLPSTTPRLELRSAVFQFSYSHFEWIGCFISMI